MGRETPLFNTPLTPYPLRRLVILFKLLASPMAASIVLIIHMPEGVRCTKFRPLTLYSAKVIIVPHRIMWSWYTGRRWVNCYIWYNDEGIGRGGRLPRPLLAVPNVTAHTSTASVPITVLLYNGPLLCVKGLWRNSRVHSVDTSWNRWRAPARG